MGSVARYDGEWVHMAAFRGTSPQAEAAMRVGFPRRPDRGSILSRAVLERAPVQIADVLADPEYALKDETRLAGYRSNTAVPMIKDGLVIGSIGVCRPDPGLFSGDDVALLQTFADQAVIAIENVRLFRETKEALDQQRASGDILSVISTSVADPKPVFEKILDSCQHLFATKQIGIFLVGDDGLLHATAFRGSMLEGVRDTFPRPLQETTAGVVIRERRPRHIPDVLAAADATPAARGVAERSGNYSSLVAPMLWEDKGIGSIVAFRQPPRPFSDKEIALLKTFANQAVIAIQNARLFNETQEALERQTATAEVLEVIGSSVADPQPVFDKILDSCEHLFATEQLGIFLAGDDGQVQLAAWKGAALDSVRQGLPRPMEQTVTARAMREKRSVYVPDGAAMADQPEAIRITLERMGNFSAIWAPMLWQERGVGSVCVMRFPPQPFSDKEIALLETFAGQAVIAIQNARMVNETKEALDRQTAMAEVLEVIGNSMADARPVFDKILRSCQRLFASAQMGIALLGDDGRVHFGAHLGSAQRMIEKL
ncbi:MAG TPA: GAF domain-containing protein, partial [Burkholderiaceae bacterium]